MQRIGVEILNTMNKKEEKTYEVIPLTEDEVIWYTGIPYKSASKVSVNPPWFPIELFCPVKKGKYDLEQGAKEFGIMKGFCGSAGLIFKNEFISNVLSVLERNGYKQKGE